MLEDDKNYPEIVQQISSVRGALDSVMEVIVQDLVEHYVSQTEDNTPGRNRFRIKGNRFKYPLALIV